MRMRLGTIWIGINPDDYVPLTIDLAGESPFGFGVHAMRHIVHVALVMFFIVAVFPVYADLREYVGPNNGDWDVKINWFPPFIPTINDDVIITRGGDPGANVTCIIPYDMMTTAVANSVTILNETTVIMKRFEDDGTELIVDDTFTVDAGGKFVLQRVSVLTVANQITVNGEFFMKTAYFEEKQGKATARNLVIGSDGVVEVNTWALLTLTAGPSYPSTIDGTLTLGNPLHTYGGILQVAADHTMNGKGDIFMKHFESGIEGKAPTDTLTLSNSCSSGMLETCALVLHGVGEVEVELVNNTYVIADYTHFDADEVTVISIELMLLDEDKSGSGFWIVRTGHVLLVECDVTGSGTWEAIDETDGGTIQIGSAVAGGFGGCVLSTGDVNITGTGIGLRVEALGHFCTSGKLTAGNASSSVVSEIKASHVNNNTATFNATATGCGPCPTY